MNRRVNNVLFLNCNQGNNVVCYTSVGENKCEFVLLVRLPEYVYEPSLLLLFMSFSISFLQQHKLLSASIVHNALLCHRFVLQVYICLECFIQVFCWQKSLVTVLENPGLENFPL